MAGMADVSSLGLGDLLGPSASPIGALSALPLAIAAPPPLASSSFSSSSSSTFGSAYTSSSSSIFSSSAFGSAASQLFQRAQHLAANTSLLRSLSRSHFVLACLCLPLSFPSYLHFDCSLLCLSSPSSFVLLPLPFTTLSSLHLSVRLGV